MGDFRSQTTSTQGLIIGKADNSLASQKGGVAAVRDWARATPIKGEFYLQAEDTFMGKKVQRFAYSGLEGLHI